MHVPGRILATLQRKFWDSNKVSSFVEERNPSFGSWETSVARPPTTASTSLLCIQYHALATALAGLQ